jgi:hypothetical protein
MLASDKQVAHQVHELLLSAHPERNDPNLIKAALYQSSAPTSPSLVKDQTFIAIRTLQAAIAKGSSAEQGERLLMDAVHAAEDWVVHAK